MRRQASSEGMAGGWKARPFQMKGAIEVHATGAKPC